MCHYVLSWKKDSATKKYPNFKVTEKSPRRHLKWHWSDMLHMGLKVASVHTNLVLGLGKVVSWHQVS